MDKTSTSYNVRLSHRALSHVFHNGVRHYKEEWSAAAAVEGFSANKRSARPQPIDRCLTLTRPSASWKVYIGSTAQTTNAPLGTSLRVLLTLQTITQFHADPKPLHCPTRLPPRSGYQLTVGILERLACYQIVSIGTLRRRALCTGPIIFDKCKHE